MQPAARERVELVAGLHTAAVDDLVALDGADDEAGDVVVAERVDARHLRGLAADERAARRAAGLGDALDELGELLGDELAGRVVVEEEERLGAAAEDVVDAVVDEVDADPAVPPGGDRHLDLGADRVRARGEHAPVRGSGSSAKRPLKAPMPAEDLRRVGRRDRAPDQADGTIALIDIDAGVCVAKVTHRAECIGGRFDGAEGRAPIAAVRREGVTIEVNTTPSRESDPLQVNPTDTGDPNYFHRVVDCQWACPAHTNVPEYIRLIAQGRYTDAYMSNRESNVFPGILGRTCDRPCEPACRRTRIDGEPVAICRLKRVASDLRGDIADRLPVIPKQKNGRRVVCIGAGPASLTVANDLMPLGYEVVIFEQHDVPGGLMRTNIPSFRLPAEILDEEIATIVDMGVDLRLNTAGHRACAPLLEQDFDAVFIGTGAPRGKDLDIPGPARAATASTSASTGSSRSPSGTSTRSASASSSSASATPRWTAAARRSASAARTSRSWRGGRADSSRPRPGSSRTPRRRGSRSSSTTRRPASSSRTASSTGMEFERLEWDEQARHSTVIDTVVIPCDDVILAIGQENAFPWIERDIGIEFGKWDMPVVDPVTFQSTLPGVFFGGDSAMGPEEHHLGGRARPPGGDLDPQPLPGRGRHRAPAAGDEPRQPEDGAHRVELPQRLQPLARGRR